MCDFSTDNVDINDCTLDQKGTFHMYYIDSVAWDLFYIFVYCLSVCFRLLPSCFYILIPSAIFYGSWSFPFALFTLQRLSKSHPSRCITTWTVSRWYPQWYWHFQTRNIPYPEVMTDLDGLKRYFSVQSVQINIKVVCLELRKSVLY